MSEIKNVFAVNDTDASVGAKQGGVSKFGLNTGFITKFEVNENAGKDGAEAFAVDTTFDVGGKEFRTRMFLPNGGLYGKNNVQVMPGEEGYDNLFYDTVSQIIAVIKHTLKAIGVTENSIERVVSKLDPEDITGGIITLCQLAPKGYQEEPVDAFLEYQWNISEGQTRTYPTLPKNMKGGAFLCASVKPVGEWKEEISKAGLAYVDEKGNEHPFTRNASFMESNKGTQQGGDSKANSAFASNPTKESAQEASWS
jgi:hypothetical protein